MENSGVVSVTSQDMTDNRPRRMTSARLSPRMRARRAAKGQLVRQDGDENQVINAQDDLKNDQGKQADPRSGVQQPLHQELQKLLSRQSYLENP